MKKKVAKKKAVAKKVVAKKSAGVKGSFAKRVVARALAQAGTTLSDDQMQELAQEFHDLSVEVGQVRLDAIKNGAQLTDPQIVNLAASVYSLKNTSDKFALQAANLTLADAQTALNQVSVATKTADNALNGLTKIDKAVQIASAAIVLGEAIASMDMGQIASASQGVLSACGLKIA